MPQDTLPGRRIFFWFVLSLVLGCAAAYGVQSSKVFMYTAPDWNLGALCLTGFAVSFLLAWVLRILPGDGARWLMVVSIAVPTAFFVPPITFVAAVTTCIAVDMSGGERCILL